MLIKKFPVLLKHIDEDKLALLSTDDFLLIDAMFNEKPIHENQKPRIEQLDIDGVSYPSWRKEGRLLGSVGVGAINNFVFTRSHIFGARFVMTTVIHILILDSVLQ